MAQHEDKETSVGEAVVHDLTSWPVGQVLTPSGWMPQAEWQAWIHSEESRRMTKEQLQGKTMDDEWQLSAGPVWAHEWIAAQADRRRAEMDKERTAEQVLEAWYDKLRAMGDKPAGPDTYWFTPMERKIILERHEAETRHSSPNSD